MFETLLEFLKFDGHHCDVQLHQVYNTDVNFQHSLVEEPQCGEGASFRAFSALF